MTISKSSKIKENTSVYIVNGNWTGYVIKDCVTGDLVLFIPIVHYTSNRVASDVWTFKQGSTYEDIFPSNDYNIRIYNTEENQFSNFLSLLKELCEGYSSNRFNTRGEYFINGDDIQFYTYIEDDAVITCKIKRKIHDDKTILLNRDVKTVQEYRQLIQPILDKYKTSLSGAIQILHEPYGILRTRHFHSYREPDSVELEECALFGK